MKIEVWRKPRRRTSRLTDKSNSSRRKQKTDPRRYLETVAKVTSQESTWQYNKWHLAVNHKKTSPDGQRYSDSTLEALSNKLVARRLLLTCSGAGSTELSPKPAEGRCNSPRQIDGTLTVHRETSDSRKRRDSPGRLRYLASTSRDSWQWNTKSDFPRRTEVLIQYIGSTWQQTRCPATAAHLLRCRINWAQSKTSRRQTRKPKHLADNSKEIRDNS